MSPFLAPTCFGYSPSSGSSQPNSLKLTAKKKTVVSLNYKWNILAAIVHLLATRDCNYSQCTDTIIGNSIPYYKEIKMFQCVMCSLHVTPHFAPRCKHQAYSMLQSSCSAPNPQTYFMNIIPKGRRLTTFINVMGEGRREGDTNLNTLNSRLYKLNNKQFARSGGPGSVVGIGTAYWLDGPGIESRRMRDFAHLSRPALRPTQLPVKWV